VDTFFSLIQVALSIVLVFLVLMHSGKDAGLSGAFGVGTGVGPLGGGSLVERNLNRWTIAFAILFVANTILLLKHPWTASASSATPKLVLPTTTTGTTTTHH
jgi:preprotein translocase subunit SecG